VCSNSTCTCNENSSGTGGVGRIAVKAATVTGTTSPTLFGG
jgi:hypothetical protein